MFTAPAAAIAICRIKVVDLGGLDYRQRPRRKIIPGIFRIMPGAIVLARFDSDLPADRLGLTRG